MPRETSSGVRASLLVLAALLETYAQSSAAAEADRTPGTADAGPAEQSGLEEVVITSQKRAERLQDVPAAITAITQQQLEARGVTDIASLSRVAPSMSFTTQNGGTTEPRFSLRGMTAAGGLSPVVSVYVDDTPLDFRMGDNGGQNLIDLYDLERVEVLRGPQGTILGASSLGGAVRIVTAKPSTVAVSASTDFSASMTQGGAMSYFTKGALNLPLSSNAALRVVLTHTSDGGWIDSVVPASYSNPTPGLPVRWRNANSSDSTSARVELAWDPTDTLTVRPSLIYQQSGLGDSVTGSYKAAWGNLIRPQLAPEKGTVKFGIAGLTLDKKFDQFTLTSASNVVFRRKDILQDFSEPMQAFAPAFGLPSTAYPSSFKDTHYDIGYSEEIRATSTGSGPLRWIGGVYYNISEGHETEDQRSPIYVLVPGLTSDQMIYYDVPVKDVQIAGFGEANYSFDEDRFEIAAGARVYRVDSRLNVHWQGPFGAPDTPLTKSTVNGVSPRLSATFKPSSRASFYATYSEGFRPGGPNPGEAIVGDPYVNCTFFSLYKTSYAPDKSKNLEVGIKTQPFSGFSMNLAAYQLTWSNFQAMVSSSCGAFNDNLGNARNRGVEWEAQARLGSNFSAYGGLSFNNGVITSVLGPVAAANIINVGQRLANAPRLQANLGAEADLPLQNSTRLYARANWQYSGETPTSYSNSASTEYVRKAYRNIDTTLGWQNAAWDLSVYGRNLTNDPQIQTIAHTFVLGPDLYPGRPRTFGVEARYSFH